jgi:hypothetical protein
LSEFTFQKPGAITQSEILKPGRMPSLKSCAEWQNYTKSLPDCNPVEVDIANYHLRLKIHIQSGDFVGDETKVNALTTYCGNCSSSGLATGKSPRLWLLIAGSY